MGVGVSSAEAGDERACVSQQEYQDVRIGWRQATVADHFDVPGREIGYSDVEGSASVDTVRLYPKCSSWGSSGWFVGVGYANRDTGYPDKYMRVWGKDPSRPEQLLAHYRVVHPAVQPDGGAPCVTQREYRDIRWGWLRSRVANHFDTRGSHIGYSNSSWYVDTVWKYRKCSTWGPGGWYVGIIYNNYDYSVDEEGGSQMRLMLSLPSNPARLVEAIFGRNRLYY